MAAEFYRPKFGRYAAFRHRRRPQMMSDVLKLTLRKFGLDQEISRYEFVLHWEEIVGKELAKVARPESFKNGILIVAVKNSSWAQELAFQKGVILSRLKRYLNHGQQAREVMFKVVQAQTT